MPHKATIFYSIIVMCIFCLLLTVNFNTFYPLVVIIMFFVYPFFITFFANTNLYYWYGFVASVIIHTVGFVIAVLIMLLYYNNKSHLNQIDNIHFDYMIMYIVLGTILTVIAYTVGYFIAPKDNILDDD